MILAGSVEPRYDENTLLLLHGENFKDYSKFARTITNNGVTVSTAKSKFGGSSLYFNGSSCLLLSPPLQFYSGDFTIDWWEYVTNSGSKARFSSAYSDATFGGILLGYGGTAVYASSSLHNSSWSLINGTTMFSNTLNAWVHWAVVRSGNTLTTYRNGTKFAQTSISGSIYSGTDYPSAIGDYRSGDHAHFIGYIDEFRISNIARWTGAFTPPTEPYEA